MFCQKCGKERMRDGKFCYNCGTAFFAESKNVQAFGVSIFPVSFSIFFLLVALFDDSLDIGYFTFLRWVVMGASLYYLYFIYKSVRQMTFWVWLLIIFCILFNPLVPIFLDKETWQFIDLVTLVLFSVYFFRLKKGKII